MQGFWTFSRLMTARHCSTRDRNIIGMAVPTTIAGKVELSSTQAADLQSVLGGSILDEISSTTVSKTVRRDGRAALAANIVNAVNLGASPSATPAQNSSELVTRSGSPTSFLPAPPSGAVQIRSLKARREVVARAVSSVSQTRVWNLLIDVVAQTGHYKPNAGSLQNDFVVEGEEHYWVHVAIDRFTGQVIDKQIEKVAE